MIDALIGGKLYGKPAQRMGQSGKPFYTAKVRTATTGADALFVNVITFSESVGATLLALDDGDSICLSGSITPKTWTPANGEPRVVLDMIASAAISSYNVTRKRRASVETEDTAAA